MRKPVVLGLLGLFTSLVPAFAGTVYVPVAPPQKIGDVLTTTFIASDRDGSQEETSRVASDRLEESRTGSVAEELPRYERFVGEDEWEEGEEVSSATGPAAVLSPDQLSFRGVFLNARKGDSYRAFDLPLSSGVLYKRITVDFDLYLHKWVNPLFHGVMGLRRNDRTLYAGLILRGDRAKTILDLGRDKLARDKKSGPWRPRSNYHIRIITDAEVQRITLQVFQRGKLVHTLAGVMTTPDLSVTGGRKMRVDFGGTKVADGAYFPPYGWRYSNLVVKAERF